MLDMANGTPWREPQIDDALQDSFPASDTPSFVGAGYSPQQPEGPLPPDFQGEGWPPPSETTKERRARRTVEGAQAMAEYLASEEAVRRRTERLRAVRIAREKLLEFRIKN